MNNTNNFAEEKQTRREMCRGLLRYLALGGVGLVWAGLYIRSARSSSGNSCNQSLSCGGCPLIQQCDLPQAGKMRDSDKVK